MIFNTEKEKTAYDAGWQAGYKASEDEFHAPLNTPASRSYAALPENIRRTLEESNLPVEVATAIADLCEEHEPLPPVMLEALDITREAVAAQVESEAIALLRELNDALVIPKRFQARVDAILDRHQPGASETPFLTVGGEPADKTGPQQGTE